MSAVASSSASAASSPQNAQKRFSTATGLGLSNPISNRASVMNLFETPLVPSNGKVNGTSTIKKGDRSLLGIGSSKAGVMGKAEGPWSVSVADASELNETKRESRKKQRWAPAPTYTLYVTTPTHNLTLLRSSGDIVALDSKLRDSHPSPTSLPTLPHLPVSQQLTSRKLLQTISRTLSPGISRSRTPLTPLIAPSPIVDDSATSSTSNLKRESPGSPAPLSPTSEEPIASTSTSHTITTQLATYLTSVSNDPAVKKHKSWLRFIKVGSEDLESIRVERRVRKVRSDLAQHVKSSVAPTNTNVGTTPSQSDTGEEGMRTTDDDRSFSGQSTSASNRRLDRPDVPSRSTSVAQDRKQREDREAGRKGLNFANIPEELEKEKRSSGENHFEEEKAENARRERKSRRQNAPREAEKVTVDDFDMIRVLGKGCAGKVLLVRHIPTKGLFAMKSIHKRHVLAHQELQHTLTEQAVLKKMAKEVMDPFVVRLWWSFHDKTNLYLVMDFHPGGDLATQLSRWGRLGRDRARFYAAEIVEGVEGLHRAGVIYRDLKPENVLIGSDGHIVLSDFGLSKEFPTRGNLGSSTPPPTSPNRSHSSNNINQHTTHWLSASEDNRGVESTSSISNATGLDTYASKGSKSRWSDERDITTTFCGTAEYLAPEVIQGAAYSYEVDWWSFGTMLYEMLTGITPFWADTHADMYVRVLHDELVFPDDRVLDQDTKSILRGLLQRNPMLRMKEPRIKKHPYFSMIEWAHVFHKRYIPPYIPPINPLDETDTQNFDEAFLDMQPVVNGAEDGMEEEEEAGDATAVSNGGEAFNKGGEGSDAIVGNGHKPEGKETADVKSLFDGYSFRGRRDSGSVKSSILSATAPSDDHIVQGGIVNPAPAKAPSQSDVAMELVKPTPITTLSSSPTSLVKPTPIVAAGSTQNSVSKMAAAEEMDEEEDYDETTRAAVAALDHLEREAALAEEMLSSQSQTSASSPPTSTATSQAMRDSIDESVASSTTPSANPSKVRMAANISASGLEAPIEELNDEVEEDWDMIDAPASGEATQTEVNGGKGQNLFAKGVVDTYRMLRRQESIRITSSPSYGSGTINRSFNRLIVPLP